MAPEVVAESSKKPGKAMTAVDMDLDPGTESATEVGQGASRTSEALGGKAGMGGKYIQFMPIVLKNKQAPADFATNPKFTGKLWCTHHGAGGHASATCYDVLNSQAWARGDDLPFPDKAKKVPSKRKREEDDAVNFSKRLIGATEFARKAAKKGKKAKRN